MRLPAEAGEMWTTRAHKESKQKPRESTEAREQQSTSGAIDITIPTYQEKAIFYCVTFQVIQISHDFFK